MNAKIFFGIVFVFALYFMGVLYYSFLNDMIIAILLCIATYWIKDLFCRVIKSELFSSLLSVFVLLALFIVPLCFVIQKGTTFLFQIDWKKAEAWFNFLKEKLSSLNEHLPFLHINEMLQDFSFSSLASYIAKFGTSIGKGSVSFGIDVCFIVIFLFVFFYYGGSAYQYIKRILPFEETQINLISLDVSGVLKVVFFSTILNVCLQGCAFGLVAWYFGFDGILLGVLYGLCSMIPVIGGVIVWLPVACVLYTQDNLFGAIFIAIYSLVFIGFVIDNIVKPFLIKIVNHKVLQEPLKINEFIIFFAIFAGLGAFGFWGIIIGPAITAFFIALLRIYERDFVNKSK